MKLCAIDGCGLKFHARGWCRAHYTRWRRYGNPVTSEGVTAIRPDRPRKPDTQANLSALQGFIAARNKRLAKLNQKAANQ